MHTFRTEQELVEVLEGLFGQLQRQPRSIEPFVHSNLVVRIQLKNPTAELLLDGRQPPFQFFLGPRPGEANFEMELEADCLHQIWMGELLLASALFDGQIRTKGNILKAQSFIDLLEACKPIYRTITL